MKIVITGGNGYIGSRLSMYLSQRGHEITAVCSSEIPLQKGWTELINKFIVGDIRNQKTIEEIINIKADIMIHLVSLDHNDSEKNPKYVSDVNVLPIWNLLNSSLESHQFKKFIYFSTIHVYGKDKRGSVNENQKPSPFNTYGLTHLLSEEICNYYKKNYGVECLNIRLSNSYGEPIFYNNKCWSLVINNLTRDAFISKQIVLNGDGKAARDFIHFSDICKGVEKLIDYKMKSLEFNTFNFSSSRSISMIEVAKTVKKVYYERYGIKIPIFINRTIEFSDEIEVSHINDNIISNKLSRSISLTFDKDLEEGINEIFEYLENILTKD